MTGALYSSTGISFWGGIDETNGNVIDRTHPLHGHCISDKVLVIPSGRGSCTGSQCMLELILNKKSPRALVLRDADTILCTGAVVAEEFFPEARDDVPIICVVGDEAFNQLVEESTDTLSVRVDESDPSDVRIENGQGVAITTKNLLRLPSTLNVDGINPNSEAEALALRTIERAASISGARELIPISNGHIDAVTYIGPGGLRFVQRLVELGGTVKVPTTLNSQSGKLLLIDNSSSRPTVTSTYPNFQWTGAGGGRWASTRHTGLTQMPLGTHTLNSVASSASPARRTSSCRDRSLDSKSCGASRMRVRFDIFALARRVREAQIQYHINSSSGLCKLCYWCKDREVCRLF